MLECIDPRNQYELALARDPAIRFAFRWATMREEIEIRRLVKSHMAELSSLEESCDILSKMLAVTMVGWAGIDEPFDPAKIMDVLRYDDAVELAARVVANLAASGADKKKLDSASSSDTASCAPDAPKENAPNEWGK